MKSDHEEMKAKAEEDHTDSSVKARCMHSSGHTVVDSCAPLTHVEAKSCFSKYSTMIVYGFLSEKAAARQLCKCNT